MSKHLVEESEETRNSQSFSFTYGSVQRWVFRIINVSHREKPMLVMCDTPADLFFLWGWSSHRFVLARNWSSCFLNDCTRWTELPVKCWWGTIAFMLAKILPCPLSIQMTVNKGGMQSSFVETRGFRSLRLCGGSYVRHNLILLKRSIISPNFSNPSILHWIRRPPTRPVGCRPKIWKFVSYSF